MIAINDAKGQRDFSSNAGINDSQFLAVRGAATW
jgi:hypothetical protein